MVEKFLKLQTCFAGRIRQRLDAPVIQITAAIKYNFVDTFLLRPLGDLLTYVFSSRKVTTSVSVWDGQTVVLGGLIREDVQKVEDRTPIIGDLPLFGRLFRSNVDQHIKRNLIIFVTAHLVTPGGQLVNSIEEDEEASEQLEPPILSELPAYKN